MSDFALTVNCWQCMPEATFSNLSSTMLTPNIQKLPRTKLSAKLNWFSPHIFRTCANKQTRKNLARVGYIIFKNDVGTDGSIKLVIWWTCSLSTIRPWAIRSCDMRRDQITSRFVHNVPQFAVEVETRKQTLKIFDIKKRMGHCQADESKLRYRGVLLK